MTPFTQPSPPPPPPGDPDAVTRAWARIDAWTRLNSPASYELLAPPADPAEVAAAQEEMGLRFPPELLASLACHDGLIHESRLLPVKPPLSVSWIVETWRMFTEINQDVEEEERAEQDTDEEPWWHPLWIPWAELDSDAQVIDMREGPGQGSLWMTFHDDSGLAGPGWPTLAAYLTEVADVLEHGGAVEELEPFLRPGGELLWSFPDGPNGASALTPAPTTRGG